MGDPPADAAPVVCGDNICSATEVDTCPQDCGPHTGPTPVDAGTTGTAVCGNGTCDPGEDATTCPTDCVGTGSGTPGPCPADVTTCAGCAFTGTGCPAGQTQASCLTCLLSGLGSGGGDDSGCTGGAPDGTCDATEMMNPTTCVDDCNP